MLSKKMTSIQSISKSGLDKEVDIWRVFMVVAVNKKVYNSGGPHVVNIVCPG